MKKKDIYNKAKHVYGIDAQVIKAVEELAELQKELCKFLLDDGNMEHITEEIADVEIMIEQLKLIFENEKAVELIKKAKIKRLSDRLDEELSTPSKYNLSYDEMTCDICKNKNSKFCFSCQTIRLFGKRITAPTNWEQNAE